jgi:hypothetical protein
MQCMIDIDETLSARLGPEFRDLSADEVRGRLRALLELALLRLDEATLLGLLEGRALASIEGLAEGMRTLEAILDRVLFFAVASYALLRAPYDPEEARKIFRASYEEARSDIERRSRASAPPATAGGARC